MNTTNREERNDCLICSRLYLHRYVENSPSLLSSPIKLGKGVNELVKMKAISNKLEALKTSMSSTMTGAPATYTVPMGPIRNTMHNAACLTNSTPPATFETLLRRAQAAEKMIEPLLTMLEDEVAKQNAMTSASVPWVTASTSIS